MSQGALTLPAIRRGRVRTNTDKSPVTMDLEAIRARRARLEAMTATKRYEGASGRAVQARSPVAPSSVSKIPRRQQSSQPSHYVRLEPLSSTPPARTDNELDKHRSEDPLLKKPERGVKASPGRRQTTTDSSGGELAVSPGERKSTTVTPDHNTHLHSNKEVKSDAHNDQKHKISEGDGTQNGEIDGSSDDPMKQIKITVDGADKAVDTSRTPSAQTDNKVEDWSKRPEFVTAMQQLRSLREDEQLKGATTVRTQLSIAHKPPIEEYIQAGALPLLVTLLDKQHNPSLQFQALWAVTNIASGTSKQTMAVLDAGTLPPIKRLLKSPNLDIAEQAVWAVGNLSGDSATSRNAVVSSGCIGPLYSLVSKMTSTSASRNMAWTFSNLLRHKPYSLTEEEWEMCYKTLKHYLLEQDVEAKLDAAWGVAFASDGDSVAIERVVGLGVLPTVSDMLYSHDERLVKVALRIVGNVVSGDDEQTDAVVAAGIVPRLVTLLSRTSATDRKIIKEATWALSNVTAGNSVQIQAVIDANALPHLVALLSDANTAVDIAREVAWCLSNSTSEGTPRQIDDLITSGAWRAMMTFLKRPPDSLNIVRVVLEGCLNIVKKMTITAVLKKELPRSEVQELLTPLLKEHDKAGELWHALQQLYGPEENSHRQDGNKKIDLPQSSHKIDKHNNKGKDDDKDEDDDDDDTDNDDDDDDDNDDDDEDDDDEEEEDDEEERDITRK